MAEHAPQVIQGTVVVLIACAIVGVYLWGADQILTPSRPERLCSGE